MNARVFLPLLVLLCWTLPVVAVDAERKHSSVEKTATSDHFTPILINNIFNYYGNNGRGSYNPFTSNSGFEFPSGSNKKATFADGTVWAGYHKGRAIPKAGGATYRSGLQAGKILSPGTATSDPAADDASLAKYRLYRVRPDIRPSTLFDQQLESRLQTEEAALTGRYEAVTARSIYDRYVKDWTEWPASEGAPFEDVDGNDTYDPSVDIPGVRGADQTLWYVANDGSASRIADLFGSVPIGIEIQKTIWGYRRPGALGNSLFVSTRLINKSGAPVDSMYIGQWVDADVGDASDDIIGCDTVLNLGYTYNGLVNDYYYGLSVPAVGFVLLTGPVVAGEGSDSAIVDLQVRKGVRSLRLSAFSMHVGGSLYYTDPGLGPTGKGDIQMYCLLRGRTVETCGPYIDPTTGQPSMFFANGDPVTGTGWIDGDPFLRPGDRRMLMSTGPIVFAPGDTQEIVVAHLVARGADRISSVLLLKDAAQEVSDEYRTLLRPRPMLDVSVRYPSPSAAQLSLRLAADRVRAKSATAIIMRKNGTVLQEVGLLDDGLHGDGAAGDDVFGGTPQVSVERDPVSVDVRTTDEGGTSTVYRKAARDLTIAGEMILDGPVLFSENLYPDGEANPRENVRFGVRFVNNTVFALSGLRMLAAGNAKGEGLPVGRLGAGATWEGVYDPENAGSFVAIDIPAALGPGSLPIACLIMDEAGNRWVDTLWLPVAPSRYLPLWSKATHTSGRADGDIGVVAVDRRSVRNHQYLIRSFSPGSEGDPITITLEDSTDGRVLLDHHELPDSLGHNMPLTEGFKLVRGSIAPEGGRMKSYQIPSGSRFWTWVGGNGLMLEGFDGAIGNAFEYWPSGGVPFDRQRSVLIQFAATDTAGKILDISNPDASFACRYLQNADQPPANPSFSSFITNPGAGYAYQDYSTMVPFAAFDQDTVPPRRLMVGYLENNVPAGSVDGRYWPPLLRTPVVDNTSPTGPREWFFVFDLPYSTMPDSRLQVDLLSTWTPMMWFGAPGRRYAAPREQDAIVIATRLAPETGDVWSFNPVTILGGVDKTIPSVFEALPNYPNPFNAATRIKYALSFDARVMLRIYNILGQQVRLLADGDELEGYRTLQWDGKDDQGVSVGSGVYLYRLQVMTIGERPQTLTHVGKMVMVR